MLTAYLGDFKIHTLQYAEYYGDGDNKSFSREENVYQASGITVKKKRLHWSCAEKGGHNSSQVKARKPRPWRNG